MGRRAITVEELSKHATPKDCWVLVNGQVYDFSRWASNHPGGPDSEHVPNGSRTVADGYSDI